jgi:hypothetical protein
MGGYLNGIAVVQFNRWLTTRCSWYHFPDYPGIDFNVWERLNHWRERFSDGFGAIRVEDDLPRKWPAHLGEVCCHWWNHVVYGNDSGRFSAGMLKAMAEQTVISSRKAFSITLFA